MEQTTESSLDFKKQSVLYGLAFGLYSSLLMYLGYKLEFDTSAYYRIINYIFAIGIIFYAINEYKKLNSDFLKLKDALKIGLIIGLIGGLIYGIYTYFHLNFINQEFLKDVVNVIKASEDYQGREMTEDQIKETKQIAISFMGSPFFYLTLNLIGSLFQAFIISLIVGLIKKK